MTGSRRATLLVAVGLAAFSVAYLVVAFQIPTFAVGVSVQPGTFPKALGALMLALSVLSLWHRPAAPHRSSEPVEPASAPGEPPDSSTRSAGPAGAGPSVAVVLVSMVGYVALLQPLGFALVTALYVGGMTWYLGYRRHLVNAAVAVGVAAALQVGVGYAFGISLPAGPLPL